MLSITIQSPFYHHMVGGHLHVLQVRWGHVTSFAQWYGSWSTCAGSQLELQELVLNVPLALLHNTTEIFQRVRAPLAVVPESEYVRQSLQLTHVSHQCCLLHSGMTLPILTHCNYKEHVTIFNCCFRKWWVILSKMAPGFRVA